MAGPATNPNMKGNTPAWRTYSGRRVIVSALEGDYAARRAPAELRDSERAVEALEKLLDPTPHHRRERVHIYLTDPIAWGSVGPTDTEAAAHPAQASQAIVRTVQPESPGEPVAYPLTRLLVSRWFGPDSVAAELFLEGIGGVVAARTGAGPGLQETNDWLRAQLAEGRPVSIFRRPGANAEEPERGEEGEEGEVDRRTSASFVAFLIDALGPAALRQFLSAYDPARPDAAAEAAFHRPLGRLEEAWLGGLREVERRSAPFRAFVGQILPLLKPYWPRALEVLAYMLVGLGFALAMPLASKYLIDNIIPSGDVGVLAIFVIALFLVYIVSSLIMMRRAYVNSWINQRILIGLQEQMFAHLQRLGHAFYAQAKVGDIMSRLSNDLAVVQSAITQVAGVAIYMTLSAIGAAIALLLLSPLLGALVLAVIPLFAVSYFSLRTRLQKASYERQKLTGEVSTATQESLSAYATIRAFGLEERAINSYHVRLISLFRASLRLVLTGAIFDTSTGLAVTVGQLLVLGVGGYLVMVGQITIGTLLAFFGFLPSLFTPVQALAGLGQTVQTASGSLDRVNELLNEPVAIDDKPGAEPLPPLSREIRLEGVSFSYGGDRPILNDLNVTIPAGMHVAVVGPSGSGKSTLVSLLLRFWDPDEGRVLFDGRDVREASLSSLRGQIGLVFQDTFVFDTTLRENIAIGRSGATDAEIAAAARAARLDSYIQSLPAGYDTVLGERGVRMSGGQRQRLAIARALLRDPRVLILDEATSALDARTEREIMDTLEELMPGRTTISITHRLSLAAAADLVLVLDSGHLVEQGTHEQLLSAGGLYAKLYQEQMGLAAAGVSRRVDIELDRLKAVPLFSGLGPRSAVALARQLVLEHYPANEDVVRQGEPGDKLYLISRGQVEVLVGERRVNVLNDGDYFGEMALLTGQPRTATVRTTMPSELYSLEQTNFISLLEGDPDIHRSVWETVGGRRAALEKL